MKSLKVLAVLVLACCAGCTPVATVTANYNPITGNIDAGVEISFRTVRVEVSEGVFEEHRIQVRKDRCTGVVTEKVIERKAVQ